MMASQTLRRIIHALTLAATTVAFAVSHANAAPPQLLGKTVIIAWSDAISERPPGGQPRNVTVARQRFAYVSSAGRVFVRVINRGAAGSHNNEVAPGGTAGSLSFQGNQLVGYAAFAGFARRLTVSFDPSFASCTATVMYGNSSGPKTWVDFRGQTVEMLSIAPSTTSCSIRDGNAAAN